MWNVCDGDNEHGQNKECGSFERFERWVVGYKGKEKRKKIELRFEKQDREPVKKIRLKHQYKDYGTKKNICS